MKELLFYDLVDSHHGEQKDQVITSCDLRLQHLSFKITGLFFIVPCMDTVKVVDLRTVTFDVPPQEVFKNISCILIHSLVGV